MSELLLAHDGTLPPAVIRAVVSAQEQNVHVVRMQTVYENLLHRIPIRHLGSDVVRSTTCKDLSSASEPGNVLNGTAINAAST